MHPARPSCPRCRRPRGRTLRGKAIGTWSGWTAITAAIGPVLAGFLIERLSWRYAFLVNLPFVLAVLVLTVRHVPESRGGGGRLDWLGAALASLALGGLMFFLPLDLIWVHGYSATQAGAALLPFILIMFALSGWAGSLVDRHGARAPLVTGPLIAAIGFAAFMLPGAGGSCWTNFFSRPSWSSASA